MHGAPPSIALIELNEIFNDGATFKRKFIFVARLELKLNALIGWRWQAP